MSVAGAWSVARTLALAQRRGEGDAERASIVTPATRVDGMRSQAILA